MVIALDVGNNRTKLAVFQGHQMLYRVALLTDPYAETPELKHFLKLFLEEYQVNTESLEGACLSCVVAPLSEKWSQALYEMTDEKPILVSGSQGNGGLDFAVDDPNEVGGDLIADAVGALSEFGSCCFIADLGTCDKYILVDSDSAFGGCAIAPGMRMGARALRGGTAALPEVGFSPLGKAVGKNTESAIRAGLLQGAAERASGMAKRFQEEAKYPLRFVLTGGNARFVKDLLPEFEYDEDLLLIGLNAIFHAERGR